MFYYSSQTCGREALTFYLLLLSRCFRQPQPKPACLHCRGQETLQMEKIIMFQCPRLNPLDYEELLVMGAELKTLLCAQRQQRDFFYGLYLSICYTLLSPVMFQKSLNVNVHV